MDGQLCVCDGTCGWRKLSHNYTLLSVQPIILLRRERGGPLGGALLSAMAEDFKQKGERVETKCTSISVRFEGHTHTHTHTYTHTYIHTVRWSTPLYLCWLSKKTCEGCGPWLSPAETGRVHATVDTFEPIFPSVFFFKLSGCFSTSENTALETVEQSQHRWTQQFDTVVMMTAFLFSRHGFTRQRKCRCGGRTLRNIPSHCKTTNYLADHSQTKSSASSPICKRQRFPSWSTAPVFHNHPTKIIWNKWRTV